MSSSSDDKKWASQYLLDPLNEAQPSEDTGPGSHFSPVGARPKQSSSKGYPDGTSKSPSVTTTAFTPSNSTRSTRSPSLGSYPTPPPSASPTRSSFHPSNPYATSSPRQSAFPASSSKGKGHRRGSSLGERFPGDLSNRPLQQIRSETKAANRSPHLRKKHIPLADQIDSLDTIGGKYHHGGPYDATLLARNTSWSSSPVAAVAGTNAEALRATPRERIIDSLEKHVPLQGTAVIPPGMAGVDGVPMNYEEGADLMREPDAAGGAYKRWADVTYLPEDLKGKGEPSYSLEKAIKDHDRSNSASHRRLVSDGDSAYEMQPTRPRHSRQRSVSLSAPRQSNPPERALKYVDFDNDIRRSHSSGHKFGEGLKKRFVSLRKSKNSEA